MVEDYARRQAPAPTGRAVGFTYFWLITYAVAEGDAKSPGSTGRGIG
ncbi:hypothetical protein G9U52_37665 [Paenibacillus sp. S3N08]|uniref:Uncharacterized protein n=2 Tax=Paenibacillus agricola TaxID=2716264 RepID=A0ABX0JG34_9BACL|nr:hypothetical protein [Paenibacillus agricola]